MRYPLLALTLLLLASLACGGLPNPLASKPTPLPTVPVSEEAAQRAETKLQAAATQVADGSTEIALTEEELTSLIVYRLGDLPLENPVVFLRDGRIRAEAKLSIEGLSQQAVIVIQPSVSNGALQLTVEEAKVGFLSMPQDVVDRLTTELENLITNSQTVSVEDVRVEDGTLYVRLRVQK